MQALIHVFEIRTHTSFAAADDVMFDAANSTLSPPGVESAEVAVSQATYSFSGESNASSSVEVFGGGILWDCPEGGCMYGLLNDMQVISFIGTHVQQDPCSLYPDLNRTILA